MVNNINRLSIIHLDLDAFFASVEQRDNPTYRGKPLIVGGISGGKGNSNRGVVCAASYESRKYGVHAGMPIWEARQKCPQGIFIPSQMNKYSEASKKFFQICSTYTPLIEPLSIDELFLDVSGCESLFGSSEIIGRKIKERVYQELGLKVSMGIAENKFLAKIATNLGKPDGFYIIPSKDIQKILYPLPVSSLWGIGKKTEELLKKSGIYQVEQLARMPDSILENLLGKNGKKIKLLAQGIDESPVTPPSKAKSIGKETTFSTNITEKAVLVKELLRISQLVGYIARKKGYKGRTITLKIRFHNFITLNKSKTLNNPTNIDDLIFKTVVELLDKVRHKKGGVRLLGIKLSNLALGNEIKQLEFLRDEEDKKDDKLEQLTHSLDKIREKFGTKAVTRASLLKIIKNKRKTSN
ncbi:DNA polymerase IV [Candidatus Atribacteria bacterium 1244-E10-H5-B2]|nr:MAG: DNA polymerase IV [Candidatus Atribacteria bacterium 1244-E10-H5-B2]